MKNYDERIESIFRKYDARLAEKKRRNSIIRRAAASTGVCAAAIGIVWGISGDSFKDAMRPDFPDNIIVEETEPSGETTAPAKPVTTNAVTAPRIETSTAVAPKTSDVSSVSINTAPTNSTAAKRPDATASSSGKLTTAAKTNIVTDIPTGTSDVANVDVAVITTTENATPEDEPSIGSLDAIVTMSPVGSLDATVTMPTVGSLDATVTMPTVGPLDAIDNASIYYFTDDETDIQYTRINLSVPSDIIDSFIKTVRLTEETQYENPVISCDADIFTIEGISREAMIALRFEDDYAYICYQNRNYKVNTLGELMDSFAFDKYVSFKSAEYHNGDAIYGFDEDAVKKLLSEKYDARAVKLDSIPRDKLNIKMELTCEFADSNLFLFRLGVTRNGYLTTNLTGREMAFKIGRDTADELIKLIEADSSHK